MPKKGQRGAAERPYNLRCKVCGCITEKMVSRFGWNGRPAAHAYRCANPFHSCGTIEREGCEAYRAYDEPAAHAYWDGAGGSWEHPGRVEDCTMPECLEQMTHKAPDGTRHPGAYVDCTSPECEPPFDDDRPDPLAPCPLTGREHRWRWADDGCGHSGDVCACGAFEE